MTVQKPISREYRIYLALWRKAFMQPDTPVIIKAASRTMAIAMRQGMYRAIRPFRNGEIIDEQLRMACEKFVIYLADNQIEIRERLTLAALELELDNLGIDEEDLYLGDERHVLNQLEELIEREENPDVSSTPFYQREKNQ